MEDRRTQRSYRPTVEVMEALRLLSEASSATVLPVLPAEQNLLSENALIAEPGLGTGSPWGGNAWDAALLEPNLVEWLAVASDSRAGERVETESGPSAVALGLSQLDRYLSRSWYRAAIPPQAHEDCSQAVYVTLLEQLGRTRFEALVAEVSEVGIRGVLSRDSQERLVFFRAVDRVKKQALRQRTFQSLEAVEVSAPVGQTETLALREALREAIASSLSPREASLIRETLLGRTPAEIAHHWGVAPKTVSNEKSRVFQKLREVLLDHDAA